MSLWKREERFERANTGPTRVAGVPPMSELVALGWNDYTASESDPRTGATVVKTAEYRILYHHRHTARRFVQWRNGPVEPLNATIGGENAVTPLGTIRIGRGEFNSGRHAPAEADRRTPVE